MNPKDALNKVITTVLLNLLQKSTWGAIFLGGISLYEYLHGKHDIAYLMSLITGVGFGYGNGVKNDIK